MTWTPPFVSSLLNQDGPLGKVTGCGFGGFALPCAPAIWAQGVGHPCFLSPSHPPSRVVVMVLSFTSSSLHLFSYFSLHNHACIGIIWKGFSMNIFFDPWRRKWQPTPVLLPEKSHGLQSLVGYGPWGLKESGMTERLHFHFSLIWAESRKHVLRKVNNHMNFIK